MKKFISIILLTTIILSSTLVNAKSNLDKPYMNVYPMIADPTTHRVRDNFESSTLENGRLWVDKSVSVDNMSLSTQLGKETDIVNSNADDFLITLSALSQSYSTDEIMTPTDVVFIIDVSSSMDVYQLGSVSRATVMIGALNTAIKAIMEQSPENRIAVVAYGGTMIYPLQTKTYQLISLGHYDITEDYLSISGNQITVSSQIPNPFVGNRTITVEGATPTQRGIYEGAKILLDNTDIDYIYTSKSGKVTTVQRRPAIVLLSDGDPTFGWEDYTMETANDTNYDFSNGSASDFGVDLLTIATASYYKELVKQHYYGTIDNDMCFYTIGVGVSGVHAPSVLNPKANANSNTTTYSSVNYNLKTLLDSFIVPNHITFPVLNLGSGTTRHLITLENKNETIKNYEYDTSYYSSDDKESLESAFANISTDIISKGNYVTDYDSSNPNLSGYLILSDVIGENMQFKQNKGIFVDGQFHYGRAISNELSNVPGSPAWDNLIDIMSRTYTNI